MTSLPPPPSWRSRFSLLLGTLVIVLLYAGTLQSPFHFDDRDLIQENPAIHDLYDPYRAIAYNRPRPLLMLSLAFSYHFSGLNVFGYHLFNILLHSLSAIALFSLCLLLCRASPRVSRSRISVGMVFPAVLLYAVHPLNTEAITYICGRSSLLAGLFLLISFRLYTKSWRPRSTGQGVLFTVLAFLACGFSVASKEIGVVLPLLLLTADYYFFFPRQGKKNRQAFLHFLKARGPYLLPFFFVVAVLFAVRYHQQGAFLEKDSAFLAAHSRSSYVFTQLNVVPYYYLNKLFFPAGQNVDIDFPIMSGFFNTPTLAGAVGLFCLFLIAMKKRGPAPWLFFAILWFFVTLSPTSSFVPITDVAVERRLYLPGMALAFLILHLFRGPGRPPLLLLVTVLLCLCTCSIARNSVFREARTLWRDAAAKSPHKPRPHNNLGDTYNGLGLFDAALRELKTAVRLEPRYAKAHYNLGVVYARTGRRRDAFGEFRMAGLLNFSSADLHYNLGVLYADFGFPEKAAQEYARALELDPKSSRAHNNLGSVYQRLHRDREALREFRKAVSLDPGSHEARNNLAAAYDRLGRHQEAIGELRVALRLRPDYAAGHFNMGNIFAAMGQHERAIREYLIALKIQPGFPRARYNLGLAYHRRGQPARAVREWKEVPRTDPDFEAAQEGIRKEDSHSALRVKPGS